MTAISFVDTETTGLDPILHEIWEVALTRITYVDGAEVGDTITKRWLLPVDLGRADPIALDIGGFYDRYPGWWLEPNDRRDRGLISTLSGFAIDFAQLTHGSHLTGAVISFDDKRLERLLRANGACPGWHYHIVDVEALAAGALAWPPPWDSTELSTAMGINPGDYERHTAAGDVEWAKDLYVAVMESANHQ